MASWFEWEGLCPELTDRGFDIVAWTDRHTYNTDNARRATERLGVQIVIELFHGHVIESADGMCYGYITDPSSIVDCLDSAAEADTSGAGERSTLIPATFVCKIDVLS
jgi:hypothetical protein